MVILPFTFVDLIYQFTFANFIIFTESSNFKAVQLENIFYNPNTTFDSTLISWDNIIYSDTLTSIVDFICTNSEMLSLDTQLSNLIYDISCFILKYSSMFFGFLL